MSALVPLPLYDPREKPHMRTAVDRLSLRGREVALVQNARTDTQGLIVRMPDSVLKNAAPTGSTGLCLGDFAGFTNGTAILLSAWVMSASGGTAIFSQSITTGAYTEITDAGNGSQASTWGGDANGKTRFTNETAPVAFCTCTTPRRVIAGTVIPSLDVVLIQNGENYPMIYNPNPTLVAASQLMWHQAIVVPNGAENFRSLVTWSSFWAVKGNTKTYAAGGVLNQATHLSMSDSTLVYGVSDATLRVVKIGLGTASTTNDIGTVRFPVSGTTNREKFQGTHMYWVVEASDADIAYVLKDCKIELGKENVTYASVSTWSTIYDPTSSDVTLNTLPDRIPLDQANNRYVIPFSLQNITQTNRQAYHIRLTRVNTTAPSAAKTLYLLAVGSCGASGGFPYGTEWTATYSDRFAFAESQPYVQSGIDCDQLQNIGGPKGPDVSTSTPLTVPRETSIFYDNHLKIRNSDYNSGAVFTGGLQGVPTQIDLYFRNPATETTPYYYSSYFMWTTHSSGSGGNTHDWQNANGSSTMITIQSEYQQIGGTTPFGFGYGDTSKIDYKIRDKSFPAPADENQVIPIAAVIGTANGRLFVGRTQDASGNYLRGQVKFSDWRFFNRFRIATDITDQVGGNELSFDGETIQAIIMAAAAAEGASTIYIITNQSFSALGTAGGSTFIGSGFDGVALSRRYRISADGTNEPFSVEENNGILFWINNQGHIVRFDQGDPMPISIGQVTNSMGLTTNVLDIIAAIPAARRGHAVGVFNRFRYYLFVTPAAGTSNTRCAIWNELYKEWESLDSLTSCEHACRAYDSTQNGAGQLLVVHGSNGQTYSYEGGTGTVAFELDTKDYLNVEVLGKATPGSPFLIEHVEVASDLDAGHTLTITAYPDSYVASTGYAFSLALDTQATQQWLQKHIPSGTVVAGRRCRFVIAGTLAGGTRVSGVTAYAQFDTVDARAGA